MFGTLRKLLVVYNIKIRLILFENLELFTTTSLKLCAFCEALYHSLDMLDNNLVMQVNRLEGKHESICSVSFLSWF